MKKPFVIPEITVTGIADKGKAVARHEDGKVIFIENAVPGDVCEVRVFKSKKGFYEGHADRIITPSADRTTPFCTHFGLCGGCKWQYLSYDAQLRHKNQTVIDALTRIGKVQVGEWIPILGSPETQYYRNKLEFTFSTKRWLTLEEMDTVNALPDDEKAENLAGFGFHKAGAFDKVIPINTCFLQNDPSNDLRNAVRDFTQKNGYEYYDFRKNTGWLRTMMIRTAHLTGEVMVLTQFHSSCPDQKRTELLDFLSHTFPQLTANLYVINPKLNDTFYDLEVHCWKGRNYIEEHLGDVRYKISPKSFFQTNSRQAKNLYDITAAFAELKPTDNVYDLYTGTGSIACYIAKKVRKVVGIEEIDAAVLDAHENARLNNLTNVDFYTGDVKNILTPEFEEKHGKPDVIITDPPRVGMHATVVQYLLQLAAPRLVYVSCNPATQARDLELLSVKYDVVRVQPVDMFPHTHHIESVAQLRLKNQG